VVLGDHNQAETEGTERQCSVVEVIVHDRYDEETSDCDLALLRLNETFTFDCNVRPVCMPDDDVVVNMLCIATGWGSTRGMPALYSLLTGMQTETLVLLQDRSEAKNMDFPLQKSPRAGA